MLLLQLQLLHIALAADPPASSIFGIFEMGAEGTDEALG
jgi:hypothetical protein